MQVVDLRPGRRSSPPPVTVWSSPAAELIRIAAAFAYAEQGTFDVGADRLRELLSALPADIRDGIGSEKVWLQLTRLTARLDAPGTTDDLLALLADQPTLPWQVLAESAYEELTGQTDRAVIDRYVQADGDDDSGEVLRAAIEASVDDAWAVELLELLLATRPSVLGATIRRTLIGLLDGPATAMLAEASGPMARDVAERHRHLAAGRPVAEVIVEATNGYEIGDDMPVDSILLLPSYWFRPWLIIARDQRVEVLTSPVADDCLSLPSAAPPPGLVKICKALGDDGRLRLLRRMSGTAITLSDAMAELDVAKTTAHHHLAILRQAGLVAIRGEGRDTTYALRAAAPEAVHRLLADYLGDGGHVLTDTARDGAPGAPDDANPST